MERKITTQIGSLPYEDVKQAVEYSLRHHIPFLPELPKKGEYMLEYIKHPGILSCLDEFKKQVRQSECQTIKIQCVGPATLILSGYNKDEAVQRIYEHISIIMDGLKAEEIMLFLDEPALGQAGFDYKKLWMSLFNNFNAVSGVHTCGNINWDKLFDSSIEIISFDASKYDITKYPKYRNNKRIAWGIQERGDVKDFQEGDLLTLPCGMSPLLYYAGDCEGNLEKLLRVSKELTFSESTRNYI